MYELTTDTGKFLRYGISQNPAKRYPSSFMADKRIILVTFGSRADMLALERQMATQNPGPLNLEPSAGNARGGN